jgi:NADPH-dependent 2,4-dienoyl-CoA reductase/sulfur reductase-like enzyme
MAVRSPEACWVYTAEEIKKVVGIPVFANGNITDPDEMEAIVASGKADALALGRPLVADPEMPNKLARGSRGEVQICLRCGWCSHTSVMGWPLSCTRNPFAGNEALLPVTPASRPRTVAVIGGGPAGMTAAWMAASRGHWVTLYDQGDHLGGALNTASLPVGKERFVKLLGGWLQQQVACTGVKVNLGEHVTDQMLRSIDADVIVIATGARPMRPAIPGIDQEHVMTAEDLFWGRRPVHGRCVVLGAGLVGTEAADFVAEKNLAESVTIVEKLPAIMADSDVLNKLYYVNRLGELGVDLRAECEVTSITDEGVVVKNADGEEVLIPADTVVLALGYVADSELMRSALGSFAREVFAIGDCVAPRRIVDAISEGARLALEI